MLRRVPVLPLLSLLLVLLGAGLLASAGMSLEAPVRSATFDETLPDVSADEHARPMEGVPPEDAENGNGLPPEPDGSTSPPDGMPPTAEEAGDRHDSALLRPVAPTLTTTHMPATPAPTVAPPPLPTATLPPLPTATLPPLPKTLNIVLLGSDRRPTQKHWRTDTMIVVMINPQTKEAGIISLHRDLWVNTPRGATKINTVDYALGTSGLTQTLSALLGVPIDYYVRIEFDGMVKAIDSLGGITVNVDCPFGETYQDAGGTRVLQVPAGAVPFTGQMALDYSRSRLSSSVNDRMKRQLKVLLGVREKLLAPETFTRIPDLWEQAKTLVQTDVPPSLILPLARLASELTLENTHGLTVNERFGRVTYSPQRWWIIAPNVNEVRAAARGVFSAPALTASIQRAGC